MAKVVKNRVEVSATPAAVWDRVVDPEGINHEMWPWMTMSMPAGAEGLTIETIQLGKPLGRAWLRLFGLLPFDYDYLTIVEMEPGKRFLERSMMLSMRLWSTPSSNIDRDGCGCTSRPTEPPQASFRRGEVEREACMVRG